MKLKQLKKGILNSMEVCIQFEYYNEPSLSRYSSNQYRYKLDWDKHKESDFVFDWDNTLIKHMNYNYDNGKKVLEIII